MNLTQLVDAVTSTKWQLALFLFNGLMYILVPDHRVWLAIAMLSGAILILTNERKK